LVIGYWLLVIGYWLLIYITRDIDSQEKRTNVRFFIDTGHIPGYGLLL